MSEQSNSVTPSTTANYFIGYKRILDYFKQAQKGCPKGVGLKKDSKAKGSYTELTSCGGSSGGCILCPVSVLAT